MHFKRLIRYQKCLFAAVLLLGYGLAFAKNVAKPDSNDITPPKKNDLSKDSAIDEIIVISRKKQEYLSQVPAAISAISGDYIQNHNLSEISTLADHLPSFGFGEAFNTARFAIRGISTNGTNIGFEQAVGFNVDGYYFSRTRFSQMMFLDLERIEVLKGPQNTLIGKNNTAGSVNLVTRKPGDDFAGYVSATYDFEAARGSSIDAAVDLPLAESLRARLSGRVENRDGYVVDAPSGRNDFGAKDNWSIRAIVEWDLNEFLDSRLLFQQGIIERSGRAWELAGNCADSPPVDDCVVNNIRYHSPRWGGEQVDESTRTSYTLAGLRINWNASQDWTISSLTNFTEYDGNDLSIVDFNPASDFFLADIVDELKQITQEIRLLGSINDSLDFIGGVYYAGSELSGGQLLTICLGPPSDCGDASLASYHGIMRVDFASQDSKTVSLFGQLDWYVTDQLTLAIGGRYTDESKDISGKKFLADVIGFQRGFGEPIPGTDYMGGGSCESLNGSLNGRPVICFGGLGGGSNSGNLHRSEGDFSPNLVVSWQATADHLWYFSYTEGFKGGGYQFWSLTPGIVTPDQVEFDAESASSFELGGKHTLLDRRLRLHWAAWHTSIEDLQVSSLKADFSHNITNAGEALSKGMEIDLQWHPDDDHRIMIAATLLDGKYEEYRGAGCWPGQTEEYGCINGAQDLSGSDLQYSPKFQYNLSIEGEYPLTAKLNWGWRADTYWVADQFIGTKNNPVVDVQKAYQKTDLSLHLASTDERWYLSLLALNLGDKITANFSNDHFESRKKLPGSEGALPGTPNLYFTLPGRQIALQLRYNF